jgi:hypothetical protein
LATITSPTLEVRIIAIASLTDAIPSMLKAAFRITS